ncbi:hypothetical protein FOMPIDRAFT_1056490 [Fomitopsis schrenkii]|uniref:Uncharacterized protein n=1 Tax=Fomitopsis schrenkii TaxID=2126942 RepID=S8DJ49_FOMSC|nr:hypothetical protein FOMPIDRAFT_1056490 [Fomitopsis schrenkii]
MCIEDEISACLQRSSAHGPETETLVFIRPKHKNGWSVPDALRTYYPTIVLGRLQMLSTRLSASNETDVSKPVDRYPSSTLHVDRRTRPHAYSLARCRCCAETRTRRERAKDECIASSPSARCIHSMRAALPRVGDGHLANVQAASSPDTGPRRSTATSTAAAYHTRTSLTAAV